MNLEEYFKVDPVNGVIHLTEVDTAFENLYLQVRRKEKRIYPDDELKLLPYASQRNPHYTEWQLRTKSFLRFKSYLSKKKTKLKILDLGCGNCWFAGQITKELEHDFYCVDINLFELEQGARVFNSPNLRFVYADIFKANFPASIFDIVILNSSLQYFNSIPLLIKELFYISKPYGEVHIIDTPFYDKSQINFAKNRTLKHYMSIGHQEMANKYFHHSLDELKYFNNKIIYNPQSLQNKIFSFILEKDSPFPWIKVTR